MRLTVKRKRHVNKITIEKAKYQKESEDNEGRDFHSITYIVTEIIIILTRAVSSNCLYILLFKTDYVKKSFFVDTIP